MMFPVQITSFNYTTKTHHITRYGEKEHTLCVQCRESACVGSSGKQQQQPAINITIHLNNGANNCIA